MFYATLGQIILIFSTKNSENIFTNYKNSKTPERKGKERLEKSSK